MSWAELNYVKGQSAEEKNVSFFHSLWVICVYVLHLCLHHSHQAFLWTCSLKNGHKIFKTDMQGYRLFCEFWEIQVNLHLRRTMIFVLCGNILGFFSTSCQSLSCSVSCSAMLSTNSQCSKSFLHVATRGRQTLQTHVVTVGSYLPTSVCDAFTSSCVLLRQCSEASFNFRGWFFLLFFMIQCAFVAKRSLSFSSSSSPSGRTSLPCNQEMHKEDWDGQSACYVG